jgi:hypothetical protein
MPMRPTINAFGERVTERPPTKRYIADIEARKAAERQRKLDAYREKTKPPTRHYLEADRPTRTRINDPIPDTLDLPPMIDFARKTAPSTNGHTSTNSNTRTCPTCNRALAGKGTRCRECHPYGVPTTEAERIAKRRERDRLRGQRRTAEARAAREAARQSGGATTTTPKRKPAPTTTVVQSPAPPRPALTPTFGDLGRQLTAINAVAAAIEGLPPDAIAWVLAPFIAEYAPGASAR